MPPEMIILHRSSFRHRTPQRRRRRRQRRRQYAIDGECVYSNNPTDVVIFTKSKHISNGMQFQNNIHFMIISASEERVEQLNRECAVYVMINCIHCVCMCAVFSSLQFYG